MSKTTPVAARHSKFLRQSRVAANKFGIPTGLKPAAALVGSGKGVRSMRRTIARAAPKGAVRATQKAAGVHAFPGKNAQGEPGLFVQSVRGMKGKHYLDAAFQTTNDMFRSDVQ